MYGNERVPTYFNKSVMCRILCYFYPPYAERVHSSNFRGIKCIVVIVIVITEHVLQLFNYVCRVAVYANCLLIKEDK